MTICRTTKDIWLYRIVPSLLFVFFFSFLPVVEPGTTTDTLFVVAIDVLVLGFALSQLRQLTHRTPVMEITEAGFNDRTIGVGFIPWHDIEKLAPWDGRGKGIRITMELDVRSAYLKKNGLVRRFRNRMRALFNVTPGFLLTTIGYDHTRDEILDFMLEQHARAVPLGT